MLESSLVVATWNVDSIRARLDRVLEWLDVHQPAVIGLQEVKVDGRRFPRGPFRDRGYNVACTDTGGTGGVALASRIGLDDPVIGIPGSKAPLNEQRSISATCGGLRLHTVYGPNGRKVGTRHHHIKLAWLELLAAWLTIDGLTEGQPTVLLGDLNVAPTDLDVWDPRRYHKRNLTSPGERQAFQRLLDVGLVDVVRAGHQDKAVFTWWNRRGDFYSTDRGWRLDHVLTDPVTASRVLAVWVDRAERAGDGASDHAPLVVELASTNPAVDPDIGGADEGSRVQSD